MSAMSSGVVSPRTRMMSLKAAGGAGLDGFFGGEDDLSDGRTGRGRQAGGEDFDLLALLDQAGDEEVVDLVGSTRMTASSLVMRPSFTMSMATRTAARPVRLPLRVCSM